jgi:hypothetical protein
LLEIEDSRKTKFTRETKFPRLAQLSEAEKFQVRFAKEVAKKKQQVAKNCSERSERSEFEEIADLYLLLSFAWFESLIQTSYQR